MDFKNLINSIIFVWSNARSWIIFSVILTVILGMLPVTLIWLTKEIVNSVMAAINSTISYKVPLILLLIQFGIMIIDSVFRHLQDYIDQKVSIEMDFKLSVEIIRKLDEVPYALFDIPNFYNHIERIQRNAGDRFLSPIKNIFQFLEAVISITSLLFFLSAIHWSLTLISVLALIPVLVIKAFYGNKQFWLSYYMAPHAREASYIKRLLIERQFAKEIKVFNLANYLKDRWAEKFLYNANKSLKLLKRTKKAEIGLDGLSAFFYAIAAGILIWLTQKSAVKIGEFVAIGQAIQSTQSSISQISVSLAAIYEDSLYINDYYSFIGYETQEFKKLEGGNEFPEKLVEGITFDEVSFKYPGSEVNALKNISFSVRPGEKIAVVGHNGSGKTTLVKCLLGLYPSSAGAISIDGIDIDTIDPASRKKNMTAIFQDFIKYSFTVKENVTLSNIEDIENEGKMVDSTKKVGIHEDILTLPLKYDTNLGRFLKEGVDLSGGQWQKIALSRAIFKDSKVIILDEPTAALDPEAEVKLIEHFKTISEGKTSFFISHRMALGKVADRVMVMKKGELVEMGTHEELISENGEYTKLYNVQAQLMNNSNKEVEVL